LAKEGRIMDLLRAQLARIQQQLSGLTASQKMLAASLVAIMAMTLFWWGRYAGTPALEPLLDQSFTADDIARIGTTLDHEGISHTVSGDRILVPADRKIEILADLGYNNLLPQNTYAGFDEISKQMTPWDDQSKDDRLWLEIKQRTLASVIGRFPGVTGAVVVIDPHQQRTFDGNDVQPSAMVSITTRDANHPSRQLGISAAKMVAAAEAGLATGHVTVIIDGATIPIPDGDADSGFADGSSNLDEIRANEEYYRDQIEQYLQFIHGEVYVSVRVDLKTQRVETHQTVVDPKNVSHQSLTEEDHSVETASPPPNGGEPGATANLGANAPLSVGGGAATGATSTETETKSTFAPIVGQTDSHTIQPPGDAPPVSASVRVPRSYFLAEYKEANKTAPDPDDATLNTYAKDDLNNIKQEVQNRIGVKSADAVTVNLYDDAAGPITAGGEGTASAEPGVTAMVTGHVKEIGVGGLAVASLFMVMMMVRKTTPAPIPVEEPESAEKKGPQRLGTETPVVGEVSEGEKTMDGMELDDEAVQTQQVIEQVSSMVADNPDAAATLVKRWLNRA
jgi:flagellar biosynthesis/type III secretory pathway M-ring protein FliF/YscJ